MLLFSPPPLLAPVSLPFFCILFFSCSPLTVYPLPSLSFFSFFFFPSQPGCVSELTSQRGALQHQSLHWHDMYVRSSRDKQGGGKVPLLLLMRPLTALSNSACVFVFVCVCRGGGVTHTHTQTHQWIYSRCKHNAYNNKQTQLICGSRCAKIILGRFRTFSNARDRRSSDTWCAVA